MSFDSFNLPLPVARAVKDLGFDNPTAIQEKSIPLILEGKGWWVRLRLAWQDGRIRPSDNR